MIKKHYWFKYGRRRKLIEITIRDEDNKILDSFKTNNQDDYQKIVRIIRDKYGFDFKPEIPIDKSVNKDYASDMNW